MSRTSDLPPSTQAKSHATAAADVPQVVTLPSVATEGSAPGKFILCGEHAVVYSRPAIALPLSGVRARAVVQNAPAGSGITVDAPDIGQRWRPLDAPEQPLSELIL